MKGAKNEVKQLETGVLQALRTGAVPVPHLLLTRYPKLGLSDTEAMLLIHLMSFIERERKDFPTHEEIQSRMSAAPEAVIEALQRLVTGGYLSIEEERDPITGIHYERYNLDNLLVKLAADWAAEAGNRNAEGRREQQTERNLFAIFEKEFARPLTPMELETISGWLDQDGFQEELILAALKEAVFAGKVHFRYIDRILLEWQRNRILTAEQAKQHAQKFRGR